MSRYPEHDKLSSFDDTNAVAEVEKFLNWLKEQVALAQVHEHTPGCRCGSDFHEDRDVEGLEDSCPVCIGNPRKPRLLCGYRQNELEPVYIKTRSWLSEYFDIDHDRLDQETDAMLQEIREMNSA